MVKLGFLVGCVLVCFLWLGFICFCVVLSLCICVFLIYVWVLMMLWWIGWLVCLNRGFLMLWFWFWKIIFVVLELFCLVRSFGLLLNLMIFLFLLFVWLCLRNLRNEVFWYWVWDIVLLNWFRSLFIVLVVMWCLIMRVLVWMLFGIWLFWVLVLLFCLIFMCNVKCVVMIVLFFVRLMIFV